MDYTITINPENWEVFLRLKPLAFSFRPTMANELKKIKIGDRLVIYLAQQMAWTGVYQVIRDAYYHPDTLYPTEAQFTSRLEVKPIIELEKDDYIPIKTPKLWNALIKFTNVDHTKNGWIYNAQLARSLTKIDASDTNILLDYMTKLNNQRGAAEFKS